MKNLGLSLRNVSGICLFSVVGLLIASGSASAQQGKYVAQASARLVKLIDAGNSEGYGLQDNLFSLGGGWLKQSKTEWIGMYTLNLKAGKAYRFLAAGDNDAKDVDLQVTDAKGQTVYAVDAAINPEAVVNFTPKVGGVYLVRVRLFASQGDAPCVCLTVVLSK